MVFARAVLVITLSIAGLPASLPLFLHIQKAKRATNIVSRVVHRQATHGLGAELLPSLRGVVSWPAGTALVIVVVGITGAVVWGGGGSALATGAFGYHIAPAGLWWLLLAWAVPRAGVLKGWERCVFLTVTVLFVHVGAIHTVGLVLFYPCCWEIYTCEMVRDMVWRTVIWGLVTLSVNRWLSWRIKKWWQQRSEVLGVVVEPDVQPSVLGGNESKSD